MPKESVPSENEAVTKKVNRKPTLEERSAKIFAAGKAPNLEIALIMARKEKAKEIVKAQTKDLKIALKAKKTLEAEQARKNDRRRKILIGGWMLGASKNDARIKSLLLEKILPELMEKESDLFEGFELPTEATTYPGQPGADKILVKFPDGNPGREVLDAMKATGKGWKWDSENAVWTGEADPEVVRNVVDPVAVEIREA